MSRLQIAQLLLGTFKEFFQKSCHRNQFGLQWGADPRPRWREPVSSERSGVGRDEDGRWCDGGEEMRQVRQDCIGAGKLVVEVKGLPKVAGTGRQCYYWPPDSVSER